MAKVSIRSIGDVRSILGDSAKDWSDEDVLDAFSHATGISPTDVANKLGYDTEKAAGPWAEKGSAGLDAAQASLYGVGEALSDAVGAGGARDFLASRRRANNFASQVSGGRATAGGIPDRTEDVDGIGSGLRYVGGL